jgi:hypothetical protein
MYKKLKDLYGNSVEDSILRLSDNAVIPFDLANTDFQKYLEWTKASPMNVALPADEVTE